MSGGGAKNKSFNDWKFAKAVFPIIGNLHFGGRRVAPERHRETGEDAANLLATKVRGLMKRSYLVMTAILFGALVSSAQQTTNSASKLAPVVVKAEKEQAAINPQTTPAAVTQINEQQVRETGVTTIYDLPAAAPGLSLSRSVARSFGDIYSSRGIANTEFFSDPAMVLYVDDAPAGDVFTYPVDLTDIENVEVWRGPQGDYFGRNAEAGVINVTTRKPTDTLEARAGASYSSFNTEQYNASVMGPIVPGKLRFSLGGGYDKSDGFIENSLRGSNADREENMNGRAHLEFSPRENLEIGLTVSGVKYNDGIRMVPLGGDPRKVSSDIDPSANAEGGELTLHVQRTYRDFIATFITTRRDFSLNPLLLDLDLSPMPGNTALIKQDERYWSKELRFESLPDADTWKWRGGLFLSTSTRKGDDTRDFIAPDGAGGYLPVSQQTKFTLDEDDYALFGQATYAGFGKLGITAGARLDYTEKNIDRTLSATPGYPVPPLNADDSFFTAAPKLTLDYRCAENILSYVSSGLGFKPGGYSAYINPPADPSFDTERNWANEAGVKTTWLDKKVTVNACVFYNDIHDYQIEKALVGSTDLVIVNAPEVISQGAEAELAVKPVKGLALSAAAAYTDAQFDRFTSPDTGADLNGKHPPFVPSLTATLAAHYNAPCGGFARAEYQTVGKTYFDETNTPDMTEPAYGIINARVGYTKKDFTIALFGRNLTDEDYYTRRQIVAVPAGIPGEPRIIGISAEVKY